MIMKRSAFWDISPCIHYKQTDVSKENATFVFKIEE
jgi:hypothetical protein